MVSVTETIYDHSYVLLADIRKSMDIRERR